MYRKEKISICLQEGYISSHRYYKSEILKVMQVNPVFYSTPQQQEEKGGEMKRIISLRDKLIK